MFSPQSSPLSKSSRSNAAPERKRALRRLILAPQPRGLGLGARLTDECIAFARAIDAKPGFELIENQPYQGFGQPLVSESSALKL